MFTSLIILYCSLYLFVATQAISLTIHKSCYKYDTGTYEGVITNAIDEAIGAAKSAYNRLNSDTDTDFAAVYQLLFNTPKDKTDTNIFKKVSGQIARPTQSL